MPREGAIRLEGRVVARRPNGTCQVELANGHRLWAFWARSLREQGAEAGLGDQVTLEVSPCDFSTGRIVEIKRQT